ALGTGQSPEEDQARCRLLLGLGDALTRMGERQAAREELRLAASLARQYGMAEELGQAALGYAGFTFERGASDRHVIPLLQEMRARSGRGFSPTWRSRCATSPTAGHARRSAGRRSPWPGRLMTCRRWLTPLPAG